MSNHTNPDPGPAADPPPLPSGTPDWVTPKLVRDTIRVWQTRYPDLTPEDALGMIVNVARLVDAA